MSEKKDQQIDPFMNDCCSFIKDRLGIGAWVPLFTHEIHPKTKDDFFLFSAIAPEDSIENILAQYQWEIMIDSFRPGFVLYRDGKTKKGDYLRFGREDGIEPILIQRHFYGMKESFFDISEELRHLYNLYYDEHEKKYVLILDDGNEEDIIRISENFIQINAKYLKEFLAIKESCLVLYYNIDRFLPGKFSEMGSSIIRQIKKSDDVTCEITISDDPRKRNDEMIFSRLLGKKIVRGLTDFDPENFRPGEINRDTFLEFIIGIDPDGNEIVYTCDERELANYFGKNKGKPLYVTPVFFKREVLEKYYSNPEKYSVQDGVLYCGGLWSLRLDNNHKKYVIVMLGDLGNLSLSEQQYWRSFNIKPNGGFSEVAIKRGFAAEFTEPSMKDLIFKSKYEIFQETWKKKYGWYLFLPLEEADIHYLKKIRIPLKESQSEFDDLVLAITKVLIDSINERKIQDFLSSQIQDEKGISKIQRLLTEKVIPGYETQIQFLRDLQNLKSTTASHRKGSEYDRIAKKWGIGNRRYRDVFSDILEKSIQLLDYLERVELNV